MPPGIGDNVKAPPPEKSDIYGTIVSDLNTHESFSINGDYIGNHVKGEYTKQELQQRLSDLQQNADERVADGNYDERINIDL